MKKVERDFDGERELNLFELDNGARVFCNGVFLVLDKKEDGSWRWIVDGIEDDMHYNDTTVYDSDDEGNTVVPYIAVGEDV